MKKIKMFIVISMFISLCILTSCGKVEDDNGDFDSTVDPVPSPVKNNVDNIEELVSYYEKEVENFLNENLLDKMIKYSTKKSYNESEVIYAAWDLGAKTDTKLDSVELQFTVKNDETHRIYYVNIAEFDSPIILNDIAEYSKNKEELKNQIKELEISPSVVRNFDATEKENNSTFFDSIYNDYHIKNTYIVIKEYKIFEVIYDCNGGHFTDEKITMKLSVQKNDILLNPSIPIRNGYEFLGWTSEKNGTKFWDFSNDKITSNITLYALWKEKIASIICIENGTIDDDLKSILMIVDDDVTEVELKNIIKITTNSIWRLYYDELGQTEIPTKIAGNIKDGNNVFYIVVSSKDGENINVYKIIIHKKFIAKIKYYNDDTLMKTDSIITSNEYIVTYKPSISGYSYDYWKDDNGNIFEKGLIWDNLNLYVDKVPKSYNVLLDANEGDLVEEEKYIIEYNQKFTLPIPTRLGYIFRGWYHNGECLTDDKGICISNWNITKDCKLVAKWEATEHNVKLINTNSDYGTISGEGIYNFDSSVTINACPKKGYNFIGWFDENDKLISDKSSYTFIMENDVKLSAKWNYYTLSTKCSNVVGGSIKEYDNYKVTPGSNIELSATIEDGYTFYGWYLDGNLVSVNLKYVTQMPKKNIEFVAKWNECPVEIEINDESAGYIDGIENTTYIGQELNLTAVTKKGYTFSGWYQDDILLTEAKNYVITITPDVKTYTAKWTYYTVTITSDEGGYIPVTVSFDLNGASGITPEQQIITPKSGFVYPNLPIVDGRVFRGWFTEKECKNIFDYTKPITESMTLYAGWYNYSNGITIDPSSKYYHSSYFPEFGGSKAYNQWRKENPNVGRYYFSALEDCYFTIDFNDLVSRTNTTIKKYSINGTSINIKTFTNIEATAGDVFYIENEKNEEYFKVGFTVKFLIEDMALPKAKSFSEATNSINKFTVGDEITITTLGKDGYVFLGWYYGDKKICDDLEYTFTMSPNNILFTSKWCEFFIESNDKNAGIVSSSKEQYKVGEEVIITATSKDGFVFDGWYKEDVKISSDFTYSFIFTGEDVHYIANWVKLEVKLDVNSEVAGSINELNGCKLGEDVVITSNTNPGYIWDGWYINDTKLTESESYSFIMTNENLTYTAKWSVSVNYLDSKGNIIEHTDANINYFNDISSDMTLDGWYLLSNIVENDFNFIVNGEANIILADNCEWTISNLVVNTGSSLTLYSQSFDENMGKLTVKHNIGGRNGADGQCGFDGEDRVDVGRPGGSGDSGKYGESSGTITINGGTIIATNIGGGNGGAGGYGGRGGDGADYGNTGGRGGDGGNGGDSSTIIINAGFIEATRIGGGDGGKGGGAGMAGSGNWISVSSSIGGNGGNGGTGGIIIINGGKCNIKKIGSGNKGIAGTGWHNDDGVEGAYGESSVVYYYDNKDTWLNSEITTLNITVYYYSESQPTDEGNYWHYDTDGVTPLIWQ